MAIHSNSAGHPVLHEAKSAKGVAILLLRGARSRTSTTERCRCHTQTNGLHVRLFVVTKTPPTQFFAAPLPDQRLLCTVMRALDLSALFGAWRSLRVARDLAVVRDGGRFRASTLKSKILIEAIGVGLDVGLLDMHCVVSLL